MDTGEITPAANRNHYRRYVDYAAALTDLYDGKVPFHQFLKRYFQSHKKHGSRDRKVIASLCFSFFRLGKGVLSGNLGDKILLGAFLTETHPSPLLASLKPGWNESVGKGIAHKLRLVEDLFDLKALFPFSEEVSAEIDVDKFSQSFLVQPRVFVRIRPGHEKEVLDKLEAARLPFEKPSENCLSFSNAEKLDDILSLDREAVIQDYNSQRTEEFQELFLSPPVSVWDCCAASGGKSLLCHDRFNPANLVVSDTRKTILHNLRRRFKKAGINKYSSFLADLSRALPPGHLKGKLDLIIADVPCSGSGTWARSPEQLSFFKRAQIVEYRQLQRKIVGNAVQQLAEEGFLLYITCSVFRKENEENTAYFHENLGLELCGSHYLKGYEMQADTLYAALFRKRC